MATRRRKSQSRLDKAAIGIGRALGKALNRIQKIDSDARKVVDARGRATGTRRRAAAPRAPKRKK